MPCLIMRRILSSFRPLMQMGTADAILDLVSSGTTLRENNLKEISGGSVLSSQVYYIYIYTYQSHCESLSCVFTCIFQFTVLDP
jgi:ATP phosphoribosyltransferase